MFRCARTSWVTIVSSSTRKLSARKIWITYIKSYMTYERSEHPLKSIFPETKLSGYLTNSDPSVRLAPQGPLITPQAPISPPHPSRPHPTNPLDPDQPNLASSLRTYLAHLVLFRPLFFAIENNLIYHQPPAEQKFNWKPQFSKIYTPSKIFSVFDIGSSVWKLA